MQHTHSMPEMRADFIVKCCGKDFFASRAMLIQHSVLFARALQGNFPLATGNTYDTGEDDEPGHMAIMINFIHDRHKYGARDVNVPYLRGYETDEIAREDPLQFHIAMFMLGDKYDVPDLRAEAARWFQCAVPALRHKFEFIEAVQRLCGPGADVFAAPYLRDWVFWFCADNLETLIKTNRAFGETLRRGDLFDAQFSDLLQEALAGRLDQVPRAFSDPYEVFRRSQL